MEKRKEKMRHFALKVDETSYFLRTGTEDDGAHFIGESHWSTYFFLLLLRNLLSEHHWMWPMCKIKCSDLHLRIIHEEVWSWTCVSWPKRKCKSSRTTYSPSVKGICEVFVFNMLSFLKEVWELWIDGLGLIWYMTNVTSMFSITNALHPFYAGSQVHSLTFGKTENVCQMQKVHPYTCTHVEFHCFMETFKQHNEFCTV